MTGTDTSTPENARTSHDSSHYTSCAREWLRAQMLDGVRTWVDSTLDASRICERMAAGLCHPGEWISEAMERQQVEGEQWGGLEQTYLVQMTTDGPTHPVKIGRSWNPVRRVLGHLTSSPFPLCLMARIPEALVCEGSLHDFLAPDRMRGEWFRPSARVLDVAAWMNELTHLYPVQAQPVTAP